MKRALVLALVLVGCGSSGDGGDDGAGHTPIAHTIDPGTPRRVVVGTGLDIGPFSVQTGTLAYSVTDTPSGLGVDSIECAFQPGNVATRSGSTFSSSAIAATGTYYLACTCDNFVDDCFFTTAITATY